MSIQLQYVEKIVLSHVILKHIIPNVTKKTPIYEKVK